MESPQQDRRGKAENAIAGFVGTMREVTGQVLLERFTRPKFDDAREIALRVLDERVDAIKAKPRMTKADTDLVAVLKDIRGDVESSLDERWHSRPEVDRFYSR